MTRYIRTLSLLLLSSAALSGCVRLETVKATPDALASFSSKPLTTVHRTSKPDFAAQTPGTAMFAAIGGVASLVAGNNLITANNVPDPADEISARLAVAWNSRFGVGAPATVATIESGDAESLPASATQGSVILDVHSYLWMMSYHPLDWGHYWVSYNNKARLLDGATRRVLATSFCRSGPDDMPDPQPTYDDLAGNGAAGLKSWSADMARRCAAKLEADLLGVGDGKIAEASRPISPPSETSVAASPPAATSPVQLTPLPPAPPPEPIKAPPTPIASPVPAPPPAAPEPVAASPIPPALPAPEQPPAPTPIAVPASAPASIPVAAPPVSAPPPQAVAALPSPAHAPRLTALQQTKFAEFLTKSLPRVFAISENGHVASVWGRLLDAQGQPVDLRQRALEGCRQVAGQDCVLYAIDDTVLATGMDVSLE